MKITQVRAVPMSDPVPVERRHRTDLGTKVKTDSAIIFVDTDSGLTGMGAALGNPGVVQAIVEHELGPDIVGEDPMFSERIYEKLYNGSRFRPAMERGWQQPEPSRRRGMVMEAIAGVDIAVWDVKAQALGVPVYQALGAMRSEVRAYGSGGWAPGDEAEAEMAGYAAKGFSAVKMRVVGRDGFSIENTVRRVQAARRGIGPDVELMVDAHGSLDVSTAIRLAKELEEYDIAWFEEPVSPDDHHGQALVRQATKIPIASGEREFTRHDFLDLMEHGALDIAQPDVARAGGFTEIRRIRRAYLHPPSPLGAARLGQRRAVRGLHPRRHGGGQLPHPGSEPGLHADDLGPVRRAVRHPPRRHCARPGKTWAGLHPAPRRAGEVPIPAGTGI